MEMNLPTVATATGPRSAPEDRRLYMAVSIKGVIFAHPGFPHPEAYAVDEWAMTTGNWPYYHLYWGDDILQIVSKMQQEQEALELRREKEEEQDRLAWEMPQEEFGG